MYTVDMFNNCRPYKEFLYWFYAKNTTEFDILCNNKFVGTVIEGSNGLEIDASDDISKFEIADCFNAFKLRPEYKVFRCIDASEHDDVTRYEELLTGLSLVRFWKNNLSNANNVDIDSAFFRIEHILAWLRSTDFYTAPASTIYHDSYVGGLLHHTLNVVNNCIELKQLTKFKDVCYESILLAAVVHDWCKIGIYEPYKRNVKDEISGKWKSVDAFKRNSAQLPFGHGVESMYRASKVFNLSTDEALAIRWHMGMFNVCDADINDLQKANETIPSVLMLQWADHLSCVNY